MSSIRIDENKMRMHFLQCFEQGCFEKQIDVDTFFSPESIFSVELLCRCRMPWVWYHIKSPAFNGINRNVRIYLAKCLMKISRLNGTAQIAAYIYIYIYIHTYITWRYKRDISLIPPCIHQLFLQTNTCAEVIKEHKKKG